MQILFFFAGNWYTQENGKDPVSLHPNQLRETFVNEENTKRTEDGHFWDVKIPDTGDRVIFERVTLMDQEETKS